MDRAGIEISRYENSGKIVVRGTHGTLSTLLPKVVKTVKPKEIQILCTGNLILDTNFQQEDFGGVKLILIARNVVPTIAAVLVNVSGNDAAEHKISKRENGANEGDRGTSGDDGIEGANSGSVHIEAKECFINPTSIEFRCDGGNGSNGQEGGDGHKGRNGGNGSSDPANCPYWVNVFTDYKLILGGDDGKPGGRGGLGGRGGIGGKHGMALLKFPGKPETKLSGKDGKSGADGLGGYDGIGGIKGQDYGWARAGFWSSWQGTAGYNLEAKPLYGWTGGICGYEIVTGSCPDVQQGQRNSEEKVTQKSQNRKASSASQISQSAVSILVASLFEESETNTEDEENNLGDELVKTQNQLNQQHIKSSSRSNEMSTITSRLNTQISKICENEQKQEEKAKSLQNQKGRANALEDSIAEATLEEKTAEMKALDCTNLLQRLEEVEEVALKSAMTAQLSSIQQNLVAQTVLVDLGDGSDNTDPRGSVPTILKASGRIAEAGARSEAMEIFQKLTNGLNDSIVNSLERGVQSLMDISGGKIPKYLQVFLTSFLADLKVPAKDTSVSVETQKKIIYLQTNLPIDLQSAFKYQKFRQEILKMLKHVKDVSKYSLMQLIFEIRIMKLDAQKFSLDLSALEKSPELTGFLKNLIYESVYEKRLEGWIQSPKESTADENLGVIDRMKSGVQKGKNKFKAAVGITKVSKIHDPTAKEVLLTEAKSFFIEMNQVFQNDKIPHGELSEFLKSFIKEAESSPVDFSLERYLHKFDQKFTAKWIQTELENFTNEKNVTKASGILDQIAFVFPKTIFGSISVLDQIHEKLKKLSSSENSKNYKEKIDVAERRFLDVYRTQFQLKEIQEIRTTIGKCFDKVMESQLVKLETMIESELLDTSFEKRVEAYKNCNAELRMHSLKPLETLQGFIVKSYKSLLRLHGGFLIAGVLEFLNLLPSKLENQDLSPSKLNAILFVLQFGKLGNKEVLEEFTPADLSVIEYHLWQNLTTVNRCSVQRIQKMVESKVQLNFDLASSKNSLMSHAVIFKDLLTLLLSHVPVDCDESKNTQGTKIRKYIKFSLVRLELYMCLSGKCNEIQVLTNKLYEMDKSNPDSIVEYLDEFMDGILDTLRNEEIYHHDNVHKYLEYVSDAKFNMKDDQLRAQSFYSLLQFVRLVPVSGEMKPGEVYAKFTEFQNQTDFNNFKATLDAISGTSTIYPISPIQHHLVQFEGEWRQFLELFEIIERYQNMLRCSKEECADGSSNTCLFLLANYTGTIQDKVLNQIKPGQYEYLAGQAAEIFTETLGIRKRGSEDSEVKTEIYVKGVYILVKESFPFVVELGMLMDAFKKGKPADRNQSFFNVIQSWKPNQYQIGEISKEKEWALFQKMVLSQITPKLNTLETQLGSIILQLEYANPSRVMVLRVLTKLLQEPGNPIHLPNAELKSWITSASDSQPLTPERFFTAFVPTFKPETIRQLFLLPLEFPHFDGLLNHSTNPHEANENSLKIGKILITKSPALWAGNLETLHFDHMFSKLTGFAKEVDQADDLGRTVFIAKNLLRAGGVRKKQWLMATQNVKILRSFKLSYILQEDKLEWLNLLHEALEKVTRDKDPVHVFSSARDLMIFLTFSSDVSLSDLRDIIQYRFGQNWLKWIISACIQKDLKDISNSKAALDLAKDVRALSGRTIKFLKETGLEIQKYLYNVNLHRIHFLLYLHALLVKESRKHDPLTMTEPRKILTIFKSLNCCEFKEKQEEELNKKFQQNPYLSYWPRLIRYEKWVGQYLPLPLIRKLFGIDEQFGEELVDKLAEALRLRFPKHGDMTEVERILQKFSSTEWILDSNSIAILSKKGAITYELEIEAYSSIQRKLPHTLDNLIRLTKENFLNQESSLLLDNIRTKVLQMKELLETKYNIPLEIGTFAQKLSTCISEWKSEFGEAHWCNFNSFDDPIVVHTLGILYRAIQLSFYSAKKQEFEITPRDAQIIALLLLISGKETGGKFGEIETGEGKSCIVAMFAAFCALLKARVHVITSNSVLAIEDEDKYRGFFAIFGLSVGNNCDKSAVGDEARRLRYVTNQIVYGELNSFQGDILNTEFYRKGIMEFSADVVIVDEVDSLLLDKGANMLYLSHDIPELKYLRTIFLIIWNTVQGREIDASNLKCSRWKDYSELDIYVVRKAIERKLETDQEILYQASLKPFIDQRLGIWIKQAFRARFMKMNVDFIVEGNRHEIVSMDKDTGVEQKMVHLSLGLQQFLQLKYQTKLSPETLKCVFMSNLEYFRRAAGNLYGITGTLGGEEELALLSAKYKVSFFGMPRFKFNKRIEIPAIVADTQEVWLNTILESISSLSPHQPILLIFENIAKLLHVESELTRRKDAKNPVFVNLVIQEYKSSETQQDFTKNIRKKGGLNKCDLILTTNLGGRGTDLKIAETVVNSGLHVILSYLPSNLRVEKQGFGRTARGGESGSVQFIILTPNPTTENGEIKSPSSIDEIKEERRIKEIQRLETIQCQDIPKIEIEDQLLSHYMVFKNRIEGSKGYLKFPKRVRKLQLEFLNNRWSVWLDSIRELIAVLHFQDPKVGHRRIISNFNEFCTHEMQRLNSAGNLGFAVFSSELTKLGRCYEAIACKTLMSTLSSAEWDEAGNIRDEFWEKVAAARGIIIAPGQYALKTTQEFLYDPVKGVRTFAEFMSNPAIQLETISNKVQTGLTDLCECFIRPSDLDIGITALASATKCEPRLSDSSSAYAGTIHLQQNPTEKKVAKKHFLDARLKILRKMEQNLSNLHLLQATAKVISDRNESLPGRNKFQDQMNSENNLLQHHLDAIQSALQVPINTKYLMGHVKVVTGEEEARKILELLLEHKEILKGYRISKQLKLVSGKLVMGKQVVEDPSIEQPYEGILIQKLMEMEGEMSRTIKLQDFRNQIVITKRSFVETLQENGWTVNDEETCVVVLDLEKFNDFTRSDKKFPEELSKYQSAILVSLYGKFGQNYNDDQWYGNGTENEGPASEQTRFLQLTEEERRTLKMTLLELGWLDNSIPLKINGDTVANFTEDGKTYISELPQQLRRWESILLPILVVNEDIRPEIDYSQLPFPSNPNESHDVAIDNLISRKILKEPILDLKQLSDRTEILKQLDKIKTTFNGGVFQDKLKIIFKKFHVTIDESKIEEDFKVYSEALLTALIESSGSFKKNGKVRVNYQSLALRVPLDTGQHCEELQDFLKEGLFHEIFTFDEFIRWYENPATFVLLLGIAEIALGVALEILTIGWATPLASILFSEGSSDLYYSLNQLYRGTRMDGSDYWRHKKESLTISAFTLGFGAAGKIGSSLLKQLSKKLLIELSKAGGKVVLFNFINNNIEQGINKNVLGLTNILDQVINSSEFEGEIQNFRNNAERLRVSSYGRTQAQDHLNRLMGTITKVGDKSIFNVRLEGAMYQLQTRLLHGMIKNLVKSTLPIGGYDVGTYSSNANVMRNCQNDIQQFLMSTILDFNKSIVARIETLERERDSTYHGDEKPSAEEFKSTIDAVLTRFRAQIRIRIADYIFEYLSGQKSKQRMYDTITAGYSTILNSARISVTEISETVDASAMKEEMAEDDINETNADDVIVCNAGSRTRKQVETKLGKENVEFLSDIHGRVFVTLASDDYKFAISKENSGLDECLTLNDNIIMKG